MLKKPKKCWQKRAKRRPIKNFNSREEKVNKTLIEVPLIAILTLI